jgi:hypothetical protein
MGLAASLSAVAILLFLILLIIVLNYVCMIYLTKLPCSNLDRGNDYYDWGFLRFSLVTLGKCLVGTLNEEGLLFQFTIHYYLNHFSLYLKS